MARPLNVIANDIEANWPKVNYAARPYLDAMKTLNSIDDNYICDSGYSVVAYFLANASQFKGDKAKELKKELKAIAGIK